jgi:transcriptional regulator with XRE-family HTH domain
MLSRLIPVEVGIVNSYTQLALRTIGGNLRAIRGDRDQKAIASRIGVSQTRLSNWERDRYKTLTLRSLIMLAHGYECSIEQIVQGVGGYREIVRHNGDQDQASGSPLRVGDPTHESVATRMELTRLRRLVASYETEAREMRTATDAIVKVALRLAALQATAAGQSHRRRRYRKLG